MSKDDDKKTIETKKAIKDAQEKYDKTLKDKHDMELARLREKYILDQISIERTGYRRGKEEGVVEGRKKTQIEMAKKMLEEGMEVALITKVTQLSEKEIEALKNE